MAHRELAAHPVLGPWARRIGPPRWPRPQGPAFAHLARAILYQQLAGAAAATIHRRFVEVLEGEVTPERVRAASDEALRGAGLSRAKLAAVRDLARRAAELNLEELHRLPDDEVVRRLVRVRGIGPWTAHMHLIFVLRRADVWPVGDLGVRQGYARIHGLAEAPSQKDMAPLGDAYRPWRSAVAWYCWRALELEEEGA